MLRTRRVQKKISQMQLAMNIGISTRHLSDMENDKSMSSKDMVLYLGQALDLPYRQQNSLLMAAGYAPISKNGPWTANSCRWSLKRCYSS